MLELLGIDEITVPEVIRLMAGMTKRDASVLRSRMKVLQLKLNVISSSMMLKLGHF